MDKFRKANIITGWLVFIIATGIYFITVEPTASFWDCSEFIASSFKLEVPHPPGSPLFLLTGRLFSLLAGANLQKVAYWINHLSAIASGFTILFLFWSITMIAGKIIKPGPTSSGPARTRMILSAGFIGAMVYTFSDSFWFSAVEAEVYAMSSFFTAFVFWAMLKWENISDESKANRWLILIFYMMGLSIGVHLLNLVTIPALGLIFYFKKYKSTYRGVAYTLLISLFIIFFITGFIMQGLPALAGKFEIFFVNIFGLPFHSGIIIFMILFAAILIYGIYYTHRRRRVLLNTVLLGFSFILIGYSSYTTAIIRSNFNPPINESRPDNVIDFVSYLKREQYGTWPLFYGQYFDADVLEQKKGAPVYVKGKNKYEISDYRIVNVYDPKRETVFPRVWSSVDHKPQDYRRWMGLGPNRVPDFIDNLKFLFRYQIGYMYLRYFMWNFAGRESDIQGAGWLRPWKSYKNLPLQLKDNKGRNNYYMLPLILGLLGMIYSYRKHPRIFSVLLMLFVFTGLAIVIYLNSPPMEPRERDYIYVGSFYAFAIWIGIGVLALMRFFGKLLKHNTAGVVAGGLVCLAAPILMASSNWDDHDRSNRYFSVDSAKNFLASCAPDAILFTGGDNDTFPLWYAQEVEGFRTDVRVIVLSYFNTDWYIDQMTRKAYRSEPLPISLSHNQYRRGGANDYLPYIENPNLKGKAISLNGYLGLIRQNFRGIRVPSNFGDMNTLPAKALFLEVNRPEVLAGHLVPGNLLKMIQEDSVNRAVRRIHHKASPPERIIVPERMIFKLKNRGISKSTLMVLDIIANSHWKRPVYFTGTALSNLEVDISPYVVREGITYRLLPVQNLDLPGEMVDTETMYENVMNKYTFRNLTDPDVDYNEDYRGFVYNHRDTFNTLAMGLIWEGRKNDAKKVLERNLAIMPDTSVPYDLTTARTVSLLAAVDENKKAGEIGRKLAERSARFLSYYWRNEIKSGIDISRNLYIMNSMVSVFKNLGDDPYASRLESEFRKFYNYFSN